MNVINEDYLTTDELSKKIKHARQTLYNFIHRGVFQQGVHFIKPSRKKILWIWPEMENWLQKRSAEMTDTACGKISDTPTPRSRIKI